MNIIFDLLPIVFYYGCVLFTSDWYIDHNDLHFKEVNANKLITPISYYKQKKRGRYRKIELFFPILEVYAHLVLIVSVINLCLDGAFSKYLYIASFVVLGLIHIAYYIICFLKRNNK